MKNFAYIISTKRKELQLTQEELAGKLGITPQAVSKWENGIGLPDVTLFPLIAKTLGVSTDTLFGIEKEANSNYIPEFQTDFNGLPFVGSVEEYACYSDKTLDHREEKLFFFTDGSVADLSSGNVTNFGKGEIRITDAENVNWFSKQQNTSLTSIEKVLERFTSLSVDLSYPCDFQLLIGDHFLLKADGTAEFIDAIETNFSGNTLTLKAAPKINRNNLNKGKNKLLLTVAFTKGGRITLNINGSTDAAIAPDFEEMNFSINGSGTINGKNSDKLIAKINGRGDISAEKTKLAKLSINGSGDINVKSATESMFANINGSGDICLEEAANAELRVLGSGDIDIKKISGDLSFDVMGSGDLYVGGEVKNFKCKVLGSGGVHGKNLTVETAEISIPGDSCGDVTIGRIKKSSKENINKTANLCVIERG